MEERIYYDHQLDLRRLLELHDRGVPIYCPRCHVRLRIALSREESDRFGVHPGVYCPTNRDHVFTMIEVRGG